jgi:hypothetical protein
MPARAGCSDRYGAPSSAIPYVPRVRSSIGASLAIAVRTGAAGIAGRLSASCSGSPTAWAAQTRPAGPGCGACATLTDPHGIGVYSCICRLQM